MTAKQLTDSILQMAIQGKLVTQDPDDEPASALLERIREEKRRLVKEGKLKKKALEETPINENEIPFKIPGEWEWCKLGWIGDWRSGATPAKGISEFYLNGNIVWLRTGELNNSYVYDSEIKITPLALEKCSLRMCNIGDVLIAMYGATIGKVAIAGVKLTTNQACCACTPFYVHNKYLLYFLMASKKRFIELGEGGAQPNISREKIVDFPFPLPPLAEQHRIVERIEELLPIIKEYGEAYDEASKMDAELPDKLKKSILQDAIMGKLGTQDPNDEPASVLLEHIREEKKRLVKEGKLKKKDLEKTPINEDEVPFKIPESWEWYRLSGISQIYTGNSISESEKAAKYTDVDGINYIGTKDINFDHSIKYNNGIRIPNQYLGAFKIASVGSILMCIEGGSAGRKIGILSEEVCFGNKLCCFSPICVFNRYLYYYVQSPILKDLFKSNITGIIGGVSISKLAPIIIPLPPLAEQHRIVEKIEALFSEIDNMTINDINKNKEETKETETE